MHILSSETALLESAEGEDDRIKRFITKTRLFKYIQKFTSRIKIFSYKKHISAQHIDFGYSLEAEAVLTSTHNLCFRAEMKTMYSLVKLLNNLT